MIDFNPQDVYDLLDSVFDDHIPCEFSNSDAEWLSDVRCSPDYKVCFGATKCVIVPTNDVIDYVIKVPFTHYDDEGELWPLENARHIDADYLDDNYCAAEVDAYEAACQRGIEPLFAESVYFGEYGDTNWPVYLQIKCEALSDADGNYKISKKDQTTARSYMDNKRASLPIVFMAAAMKVFSKSLLDRAIDFLKDNDLMDDLSDSNIGFDKYNRPVLIDYSGYFE